MHRLYKYLIKLVAFTIIFLFLYNYAPSDKIPVSKFTSVLNKMNKLAENGAEKKSLPVMYLWCITVKISNVNSSLLKKFEIFIKSLLRHSTNCSLSLNLLADQNSKVFVNRIIFNAMNTTENRFSEVIFHDIDIASAKIKPITEVMQSHFSSVPGTYYSDSLFYLSLGLSAIAPRIQTEVILLDVDTRFETSIAALFETKTLFALAPELSPVYYHILWKWKRTNSFSSFGEPSYRGYSGLNSGVVMMKLDAIRESEEFRHCLTHSYVENITSKYFFKGHLGDQDFYTLLAMEKPHLIKTLPCTWNRQLCQWWKHHGYADLFDEFARCDGIVHLYHGNCNTLIPIK